MAYTHSPFVRSVVERAYEARLAKLSDASYAGDVDFSKLSLRLVPSDRRFRTPYWILNFGFWEKDFGFEVCIRTLEWLLVRAGCQDVEMYAIPPRQRL